MRRSRGWANDGVAISEGAEAPADEQDDDDGLNEDDTGGVRGAMPVPESRGNRSGHDVLTEEEKEGMRIEF